MKRLLLAILPALASTGTYALQAIRWVGTFETRQAAESWADRLTAAGFAAWTHTGFPGPEGTTSLVIATRGDGKTHKVSVEVARAAAQGLLPPGDAPHRLSMAGTFDDMQTAERWAARLGTAGFRVSVVQGQTGDGLWMYPGDRTGASASDELERARSLGLIPPAGTPGFTATP